jgi:uncharacterized protein YegL
MRRLPIYFLIDISESMVGEPIRQVEEGLATIIKNLKTDPYAIETVYISVIGFAGKSKTIVPLQEIINFYPPKLPIGSGTSLSKGLKHLMQELQDNIIKTTFEQKGDWKPIVFLFTDGVPTDDAQSAINDWNQKWKLASNMIAISFGDGTDTNVLSQLTEHVLLFKNTNADAYKQFFKWVTDSIKTSSISVENNSTGFDLAELDGEIISKINLTKSVRPTQYVDDNFVVLSAKCQNTFRPYLIKYRKSLQPSTVTEIKLETIAYSLICVYQVDTSYSELSDSEPASFSINTDELIGFPNCPCCSNQTGFAMCICGGIHCISDESLNTCPWCENRGAYEYDESGFEVSRTQG